MNVNVTLKIKKIKLFNPYTLRCLRTKLGMNRKVFAAFISSDIGTITKIEHFEQLPSDDLL